MSDNEEITQLVVHVYFMLTDKQTWFPTKYILSNKNAVIGVTRMFSLYIL